MNKSRIYIYILIRRISVTISSMFIDFITIVFKPDPHHHPPPRYMVSNFARDLLLTLYNQPLFNMADLKPSWFNEHHHAKECRELRRRLSQARPFISCCKNAAKLVYICYFITHSSIYIHIYDTLL